MTDEPGESMVIDTDSARRRVQQLCSDLRIIVDADQGQEVQGWALSALDALVEALRVGVLTGDPVIERLHDVLSPEAVEGSPRAVDLLIIAGQILAALPPRIPPGFVEYEKRMKEQQAP